MKLVVQAEHESGEGTIDCEHHAATFFVDGEGDLTIHSNDGTTSVYPSQGWNGLTVTRWT